MNWIEEKVTRLGREIYDGLKRAQDWNEWAYDSEEYEPEWEAEYARLWKEYERKELEILAKMMKEKERLHERDQASIDAAIKEISALKEELINADVTRRLNAVWNNAVNAGAYERETADKCYTYWWQFLSQLDRFERSMKRYGGYDE